MKKKIVLLGLIAAAALFAAGCAQTADSGSDKDPAAANVSAQEAETSGGADISKFVGDWYVDGSLENGHIDIEADGHVTSYSYEDTVNYEGVIKAEEYENPDGTKGYLYNIYDGEEFVIGFYEPEEPDFYEIYSGQDGEVHYVRKDHCK